MFKWINSQCVQSDRGFTVECIGRFTDEYRAGKRKLTIEVERSFFGGKAYNSISPDAFQRWDGDPQSATLPPEEQKEMLANFIEAKEFQGIVVVVESVG